MLFNEVPTAVAYPVGSANSDGNWVRSRREHNFQLERRGAASERPEDAGRFAAVVVENRNKKVALRGVGPRDRATTARALVVYPQIKSFFVLFVQFENVRFVDSRNAHARALYTRGCNALIMLATLARFSFLFPVVGERTSLPPIRHRMVRCLIAEERRDSLRYAVGIDRFAVVARSDSPTPAKHIDSACCRRPHLA